MKIHGIAYIIIGIVISIISYYVTNNYSSANMTLFVYIGIGFVTFGVYRLFIISPDDTIIYSKNTNEPLKFQVLSCQKCGAKIRSIDNYCFYCGLKMK